MRVDFHAHAPRSVVRDCRRIQDWYGPENGAVPAVGAPVWVWRSDRWIAGFALAAVDAGVARTRNCVIAEPYRGAGGQRALLGARLVWAAEQGATEIRTYCDVSNWHSARNILAAGFEITAVDADWVQFRRRL